MCELMTAFTQPDLHKTRVKGFTPAVRDEVEIESLSESLVSVVQETMQPEQVSLLLIGTSPRGKSQ